MLPTPFGQTGEYSDHGAGEAPGIDLEAVGDLDGDGDGDTGAGAGTEPGLAWVVGPESAGERLDRHLAQSLPGRLPAGAAVSRTRLQQWIALGAVNVDGAARGAAYRLRGFETIAVVPQPRDADRAFEPDPVDLAVVDEDPWLLVIDKPAGLVTHPGHGHWRGTLMNGLLHRFPELRALPRAGIVHRLDKDTSGLLVVARTEAAQAALVAQLQARTVRRDYLAICAGEMADARVIDAPVGRDPRQRVRMAVVEPPAGRPARTRVWRLATAPAPQRPPASWSVVHCALDTGRTHQIRVHLAHLGAPLAGDATYDAPPSGRSLIARQALHAFSLGLQHPGNGQFRGWHSPLPADLREALRRLGLDPGQLERAALDSAAGR